MSLYYREQKHICGKDYATAGYMEVDLYPVTPKQHKASRRAKKKEACTLAQQTYNDNRSKRYHVQLVNANFGKGDFSWTGTYDDDHLPAPGDTKRADMDWTNYIKRVYRWCDKNGVERPKWVAATEYTTVMADGTICGRHHHHAIIQHTEGLTRDVLEELWSDKNGNSIGLTRGEYLTVDHGSVEGLVKYINKNKRCARSWRQSRGLEKPKTPPPNDTKWSRKKLEEASTVYIDDAAFWEQKYPGYTLNRVETKVSNAGQRHTVVILRRAECWHGRGNIYPGGLVKHSLNVYYALLGNFNLRGLYSPQTQAIVALLHDVCKANYYAGEYPDYTVKDQMPMGHGEKSVYLVMKHMELTDDEALAIRWHMGAYDDAFRGGSRALNAAIERTPLVLELHYADMIATQREKHEEVL